jgi:hypothetical protein
VIARHDRHCEPPPAAKQSPECRGRRTNLPAGDCFGLRPRNDFAVLLLALATCSAPQDGATPQGSAQPINVPFTVPPQFDQGCADIINAVCNYELRCGLLDAADLSYCQASLDCKTDRMRQAAAAGQVSMDSNAASTCAAYFATQPCSYTEAESSACFTYLLPNQGVGQPCYVREACLPGGFCAFDVGCPGTCLPLAGEGASCTPMEPCQDTLTCVTHQTPIGNCVLDAGNGRCSEPSDCPYGQNCVLADDGGEGSCGSVVFSPIYVAVGSACDVYGPEDGGVIRLCEGLAICNAPPNAPVGVCATIPTLGGPCYEICDLGLACLPADGGSTCQPLGGAGQVCSLDNEQGCFDYYTCNPISDAGTGPGVCLHTVCAPGSPTCSSSLYGIHETCNSDFDCESGRCESLGVPGAGDYDFWSDVMQTECQPACP